MLPLLLLSCAALQVVCGTMGLPTATVRLMGPDGEVQTGTGMGTGPVDAAYKAIDSIVKVQVSQAAWAAVTPLHQSACLNVSVTAAVIAEDSLHCIPPKVPTSHRSYSKVILFSLLTV